MYLFALHRIVFISFNRYHDTYECRNNKEIETIAETNWKIKIMKCLCMCDSLHINTLAFTHIEETFCFNAYSVVHIFKQLCEYTCIQFKSDCEYSNLLRLQQKKNKFICFFTKHSVRHWHTIIFAKKMFFSSLLMWEHLCMKKKFVRTKKNL